MSTTKYGTSGSVISGISGRKSSEIHPASETGEEGPPPPVTRRQWVIGVLLVVSGFCACAVYSCIAPFFPKEAEKKGATAGEIGLIFGIFQMIVFLFAPVFGKLMPVIGAKFTLCAGLSITGVTNILFGLLYKSPPGSTFVGLCFAVRIGQALGDCMFSTACYSIAAKEYPGRVSTMIGIVATFNSFGFTAGPALGGVLYDAGGFGMPFYVLGGVVLFCMVACLIFIPMDVSYDDTKASGYLKLLASPLTIMCMSMTLVCAIAPSFIDPTLEPHLRGFNLTHAQIGLFFLLIGGMSTFSSPLFGYIVDTYGHGLKVMAVGAFLAFIAYTFFGPAPYTHIPVTLWLTGLSMGLEGWALGMQFVPVFTELTEIAKEKGYPDNYETHGLVSGLFQTSLSFGLFLGPTMGSAMTAKIGFGWATTFVAFLNLLLGIIFVIYILCKKPRYKRLQREKSPLHDLDNLSTNA